MHSIVLSEWTKCLLGRHAAFISRPLSFALGLIWMCITVADICALWIVRPTGGIVSSEGQWHQQGLPI